MEYLRSDGIILPSSSPASPTRGAESDDWEPSRPFDADEGDDDHEETPDPSLSWPDVHATIRSTIAELAGSVVPKLNWSAPKDATWISATNSMECRTPNDVYLLLKSSDFITHDLEQAFDGCEDITSFSSTPPQTSRDTHTAIPYHLILRKTIPALIPSLEFRCFVRRRRLLCICQRDLNHYAFLAQLVPTLKSLIQAFFEENLQATFPDDNFVFDVYVPQPKEKGRVWLIDINPWAVRTDPLLFSWLEVLTMSEPGEAVSARVSAGVSKLSMSDDDGATSASELDEDTDVTSESDIEDMDEGPVFRTVKRDDPEAYSFNTPQYSAHKLPKDVVDAGADGEAGLREFMGRWRDVVSLQEREETGEDD